MSANPPPPDYNSYAGYSQQPPQYPPGEAYPPQVPYPPQGGSYPTPAAPYPPQGGVYPPPAGGYPPTASGYPPQQYPPQQYPAQQYPGYAGKKGAQQADVIVAVQSDDDDGLIRRGNVGFSDPTIRRGFIRKVYLILCLQFAVTTAVILGMMFTLRSRMWDDNDSTRYYVYVAQWVCLVVFFVVEIALVCCESVRRKHPVNIILLGVFTLALSGFVGCVSLYYSVEAVLIAMGSTCIITLGLTLFACQTKVDFTGKGAYLFAFLLVFICFGFFSIFFYSRIMQVVYASLGVLLFSMFLVYDTQLLIGGKKYELTEEEYVFAALSIYIDVIQIFLYILSLLGNK